MQPRDRLTIKEMQVAALVWEGQTNREIARAIGATEQVVKNYLRNTFDKLGVWSRLELAIYVAQHGVEKWWKTSQCARLIFCRERLLPDLEELAKAKAIHKCPFAPVNPTIPPHT